jgi:siroheme synthase-like protein
MGIFPLFADLEGEPVLVVGGGRVALRRVKRLLDAGARVTLVSPRVLPELGSLGDSGRLLWIRRPYVEGDETGFRLVFALTDSTEVNDRIAERARGSLTNVATRTPRRRVTVPATRAGESYVLAIACQPPDPERSRRLADLCVEELSREASIARKSAGEGRR